LNVLRLMIFFQVILGSFDLSCSQVLLKEIMSVISMRNYKPLLIFTNNTVSCKTMIMFFTVVVTVGLYAAFGFEITPSAIIGFLTILGYSLYDTVVVFDKVRELTADVYDQKHYTFAEYVNLAVNQTMVRSINTSVVALLPVGAILIIGSVALGPGTLVDISLALFVGMIAGTYSSIFIASPLLVTFQELSDKTREHNAAVDRVRQGRPAADGRENMVAIMGPGDVFGEMALFDPSPRSTNAVAVSETRLAAIKHESFKRAQQLDPSISDQVIKTLARRLRHANEALADLVFSDVPGRLAKAPLALADRLRTALR